MQMMNSSVSAQTEQRKIHELKSDREAVEWKEQEANKLCPNQRKQRFGMRIGEHIEQAHNQNC